jgi:hypothetical protein
MLRTMGHMAERPLSPDDRGPAMLVLGHLNIKRNRLFSKTLLC